MRNYVTFSKLGHHGRLGNQLFQISAVLAYAMEHRVCAELPKWVCNYSGAEYWRHFPSLKAGNGYTMPLVGATVYNEPCYEYASIPKLDTNIDLHGYFQSSKHFLGHDDYIRMMLTPVIPYVKKIVNEQSLAIHVRRGDYLKSTHGCLGMEYYERAIAMMDSFGKIKHINVFSDDLLWCMEHFKGSRFSFHSHDNPVVDLAKMAAHQRIIIANSSFSWWAAFLSHPYKIVISPDRWFGSGDLLDHDVFEKNWIKLPVIFEK